MTAPDSDAVIVLVLMATVLLRVLLVALVVLLLKPRRRRCPQCGEAVVPVQGPRILSLLVLERRWCMNCGWTGITRKFPPVTSGARVAPNVPIASVAAVLLLSALGCQPRTDPVAALFADPSKWVDLSHSFDEHTIYWPTAQSFKLTMVADGVTPGGWYYSAANFTAAEHGGTHLDAPVHFAKGRHTTDQIPLEQLVGPAVVVDAAAKVTSNPDYRF